jgi:hypothetical protein
VERLLPHAVGSCGDVKRLEALSAAIVFLAFHLDHPSPVVEAARAQRRAVEVEGALAPGAERLWLKPHQPTSWAL